MGIWKRRAVRMPKRPAPPGLAADPELGSRPDFLTLPVLPRTSLGPNTVVSGRLSFSTPTRIDGTLRGEVRATDTLVIGETGFVDGTIRPTNLVILGHVQGDVVGAERVEIGPHGTVRGGIETRTLIVQEGGYLDGDCRIAPRLECVERTPPPIAFVPAGARSTGARAPEHD